MRAVRTFALAFVALLALPTTAAAHGLGGEAADKSTLEFIPLGIEHMALGWDHLLFILGVVLLAAQFRRAAKLITAFVVGHSTTLIVATLAGWQVSPTAVDVVIALSLVYVGVLAWRGRPEHWRPVIGTVFGFGLIHGLGLSTRLQELGIPDDGLLAKTIAFNVGIEIGQLAVIALVVGVGGLVLRFVRARPPQAVRYAGAALMATGLVAAGVLSFPGEDAEDGEAVAKTAGSCVERKVELPTFAGGGHPKERFQTPGAAVVDRDLVHVLTDGYVVLRYRPDLPVAQRDALKAYVEKDRRAVVAAPDPQQEEPLRAVTAYRELSCSKVDMPPLSSFVDTWLEDVRTGKVS